MSGQQYPVPLASEPVLLGHGYPLEGNGHTHTPLHTRAQGGRDPRVDFQILKWLAESGKEFCGLHAVKGTGQDEFHLLTVIIWIKYKALGRLNPSPKRNLKLNEAHQVMWLC